MASYDFLAPSYDALTQDVGYPRWREYIEGHFARLGRPVKNVLDLACGTGSLTWELARRGYQMTGRPVQRDALSGRGKVPGPEAQAPVFLSGYGGPPPT